MHTNLSYPFKQENGLAATNFRKLEWIFIRVFKNAKSKISNSFPRNFVMDSKKVIMYGNRN